MRMTSSVLTAFAGVLAWCAGAAGADNGFLLGLDYSKPVGYGLTGSNYPVLATATDASGALYLLAASDPSVSIPATTVLQPYQFPSASSPYYVEKLTPQGDQVYLAALGFAASALAVDASGSAYVAGAHLVAKLNAGGTAFLYQVFLGQGVYPTSIAVDPSGKAYITGFADKTLQTTANAFEPSSQEGGPFVVQLNPDGSAGYATYVVGSSPPNNRVTAIAVDATGSAVLLGTTDDFPITSGAYSSTGGPAFLAKLKPDGSGLVYATYTGYGDQPTGLSLDTNGNPVVSVVFGYPYSRSALRAFNSTGTALLWTATLPPTLSLSAMAVDQAGNTYVVGATNTTNLAVQNPIAPCGSAFLDVYGPSGELLQSTYLPTGNGLTIAPEGAVDVVGNPGQPQAPNGSWFLVHLSQHPNATPLQLACVGNAASYDLGPVAPGELVSLFGQGLGPAKGVQPKVNLKNGFPNQLANVQVTFDGKPAPLLYVQDSQINAIVPWSLNVGATTEICVASNNAKTNCIERSVAGSAPAVFMSDDGIHAAALNQDGSINSSTNPAKLGSIVSIFANGLGPISPAQADGSIVGMPLPVNTVQWSVGYLFATIQTGAYFYGMDVTYEGPAPFQAAGVSQINFSLSFPSGIDLDRSVQLLNGNPYTGIFSPEFYIWIAGQ